MIKLNVQTYGKKDAIGFLPADLIANAPAFTGRKDRTEEDIEAMVQSLLTEGQIQDVVYRISFDRKPVLIAGMTRAIAGDRINKRGLTDAKGNVYSEANPFILTGRCKAVKDGKEGELDALLMTWFENSDDTRTPMTDVDVAAFINVLSENYGLTDAQIAVRLRKVTKVANEAGEISEVPQTAWVASHKVVYTLDTETQNLLATGKIDFNTAVTAANIAPEDRPAAFAAAATTKAGKITAPALVEAARTTGAKTNGTLKRTEKQVNEWMVNKLQTTVDCPVRDLLFALRDFKKGTITVEELDATYALLVPEAAEAAAA